MKRETRVFLKLWCIYLCGTFNLTHFPNSPLFIFTNWFNYQKAIDEDIFGLPYFLNSFCAIIPKLPSKLLDLILGCDKAKPIFKLTCDPYEFSPPLVKIRNAILDYWLTTLSNTKVGISNICPLSGNLKLIKLLENLMRHNQGHEFCYDIIWKWRYVKDYMK